LGNRFRCEWVEKTCPSAQKSNLMPGILATFVGTKRGTSPLSRSMLANHWRKIVGRKLSITLRRARKTEAIENHGHDGACPSPHPLWARQSVPLPFPFWATTEPAPPLSLLGTTKRAPPHFPFGHDEACPSPLPFWARRSVPLLTSLLGTTERAPPHFINMGTT